jgi:hypothetical protein
VPGGAYASAVVSSEAVPEPEPDDSARGGLDRIASLLEEIERRRELETRRSTT